MQPVRSRKSSSPQSKTSFITPQRTSPGNTSARRVSLKKSSFNKQDDNSRRNIKRDASQNSRRLSLQYGNTNREVRTISLEMPVLGLESAVVYPSNTSPAQTRKSSVLKKVRYSEQSSSSKPYIPTDITKNIKLEENKEVHDNLPPVEKETGDHSNKEHKRESMVPYILMKQNIADTDLFKKDEWIQQINLFPPKYEKTVEDKANIAEKILLKLEGYISTDQREKISRELVLQAQEKIAVGQMLLKDMRINDSASDIYLVNQEIPSLMSVKERTTLRIGGSSPQQLVQKKSSYGSKIPKLKQNNKNTLISRSASKMSKRVRSNSKTNEKFASASKTSQNLGSSSKTSQKLESLSKSSQKIGSSSKTSQLLESASKTSQKIELASKISQTVRTASKTNEKLGSVSKTSQTLESISKTSQKLGSVSKTSQTLEAVSKTSQKFESTSIPKLESVSRISQKLESSSKSSQKLSSISKTSQKMGSATKTNQKMKPASKTTQKLGPSSKSGQRVGFASKTIQKFVLPSKTNPKLSSATKTVQKVISASKINKKSMFLLKNRSRVGV